MLDGSRHDLPWNPLSPIAIRQKLVEHIQVESSGVRADHELAMSGLDDHVGIGSRPQVHILNWRSACILALSMWPRSPAPTRRTRLPEVAEKFGVLTFPWKSGPSGPRKAHGINAGFSPCGRLWRVHEFFPQPVPVVPSFKTPSAKTRPTATHPYICTVSRRWCNARRVTPPLCDQVRAVRIPRPPVRTVPARTSDRTLHKR
jgi:hypothetical protein